MATNDDVLVRVDGASKKFCRSLKRSLWYGIRDTASDLLGRDGGDAELRPEEFWAVDDVSFELRRGQCLGLLGRNGAGKTTLLKMLNGLIKPDRGRIEMRGRIGALIALGAGFNPILTGRENIYVNGAVLGLSKREIDAKIDEIIDFAEIGEFIDAPVQSYSSGMQVRLGFAVATAMEPDVLLIDEVLAVGDTSFKVRCYNRIRDILPSVAVVFVSHSAQEIARICSHSFLLEKGQKFFSGDTNEGLILYDQFNSKVEDDSKSRLLIHADAQVDEVSVLDYQTGGLGFDSYIDTTLSVSCARDFGAVRARIVIHDDAASPLAIAEWDSEAAGVEYKLNAGGNRIAIRADKIRLRTGRYRVIVVIADPQAKGYYVNIERGLYISIRNRAAAGAHYRI